MIAALTQHETGRVRSQGVEVAALATILACGAADALIAGRVLDPERTVWFATALASVVLVVAAAGVASYERAGRSIQRAAVTPFTIAAGTWLVLFFLRPLELYIAPDHAATSLSEFGFASTT